MNVLLTPEIGMSVAGVVLDWWWWWRRRSSVALYEQNTAVRTPTELRTLCETHVFNMPFVKELSTNGSVDVRENALVLVALYEQANELDDEYRRTWVLPSWRSGGARCIALGRDIDRHQALLSTAIEREIVRSKLGIKTC